MSTRSWPARLGAASTRLGVLVMVLTLLAWTSAPADATAVVVDRPSLPRGVSEYSSANPGSVNAFWIHGPTGLVVVDSSRNQTEGRHVAALLRATGQPVAAILVTHSHPDHVGGLGPLHSAFPETPIYASRATIDFIRTDPLGFYDLARRDDPDFPVHVTVPNHPFSNGDTLHVGGLTVQTTGFTDGESSYATVYRVPSRDLVFAGDLVSNHATPALVEGHLCGWLRDLDRYARVTHAERVSLPGHGDAAPTRELITAQRTYLVRFEALVASAVSTSSSAGTRVTSTEAASIRTQMREWYHPYPPVAKLPGLLNANIHAVAQELTASDTDCS